MLQKFCVAILSSSLILFKDFNSLATGHMTLAAITKNTVLMN